MDQKILPRRLYKFRRFDENGYGLRMITHNELFFVSPEDFNDPFDCHISIDYSQGTREEIVAYWVDYMQRHKPEIPAAERLNIAEYFYNNRVRSPEGIETARHITEHSADKLYGICSLSASHNNILLWSHYAGSHTGFAVGFNFQLLMEFCQTFTSSKGQIMVLQEVQYTPNLPVINAYRDQGRDRLTQVLTKAIDWSYEKEYRILLQDGPGTPLSIPPGIINRVILGCNISEADRNVMVNALRTRTDKPILLQAVRSHTQYRLDFRHI